MQKLSTNEAIGLIEQEELFEALINDSFYLRIMDYVPFVCAAIHDGHELRDELLEKCELTEKERLYEEDPFTGEFINSLPITISGKDSRYEYDLNRAENDCIYEEAWGKTVWKKKLTKSEKSISIKKHQAFYQVVSALLTKLEKKFKGVIVYDIHSYNYKRHAHSFLFNVGIENIDIARYNQQISFWKKELAGIKLSKIPVDISVNHIFYGRGYFLKFITQHFKNTLVLATEVKKAFMDENSGEGFPMVIQELSKGFKNAIIRSSQHFINSKSNFNIRRKNNLLHKGIQPELKKLDTELYRLVRNFEILSFVNPLNIEPEKKKFFKSNFNTNPSFKYRPLTIDPHDFKSKMYRLNVDALDDIHFRQIYIDIISAYSDKADMLSTMGSDKFLYNSLRYFGEPSSKDISNANFLLYCQELPEYINQDYLEFEEVKSAFIDEAEKYGFKFKVEISSSMPSDALVINSRKTVVLKKTARFTRARLNALLNHEVGVHVVTTMNANNQPLKFLSLGLPKNTYTQEGLAILSEMMSGGLTVVRLKELALRVLAVKSLTEGNDFKTTYQLLLEKYKWNPDKLFYLVTRVYRGGGFTKDYLYLRGFRKVLELQKSGQDLGNLMLGKTNHQYLPILNEMVDRGILNAPKYKCLAFENPVENNEILEYLTHCIHG